MGANEATWLLLKPYLRGSKQTERVMQKEKCKLVRVRAADLEALREVVCAPARPGLPAKELPDTYLIREAIQTTRRVLSTKYDVARKKELTDQCTAFARVAAHWTVVELINELIRIKLLADYKIVVGVSDKDHALLLKCPSFDGVMSIGIPALVPYKDGVGVRSFGVQVDADTAQTKASAPVLMAKEGEA